MPFKSDITYNSLDKGLNLSLSVDLKNPFVSELTAEFKTAPVTLETFREGKERTAKIEIILA